MTAFFTNPMMLLGLLAVGLPVVAHLLSRRRFDVVEWGAMQFLNPSRKTRRRMKLEELLLLLVRMIVIAAVALAISRPWIRSGLLLGYNSAGSRDVVLVIDGSNSMGRSDGMTSVHAKAIRRAKDFLDTLQIGDTVAVIDARDVPARVTDGGLQDLTVVSQLLDEIPGPGGAADLQRACESAVAILGRSSNASREVVVFTDRQRAGWSVADATSWKRFDDVLKFPAVRPRVWVVDMSHGLGPIRDNISVGQLSVSRDLTVPGFPVSCEVPIRNAGSAAVDVALHVLVDGQRLTGMDSTVSVPAKSETTFTRSVRFSGQGTHLVTVRAERPNDSVLADNESSAAVQVTSAVPVLLVEGSDSVQPTARTLFFAELALSPPENTAPWIQARTVHWSELVAADLKDVAAVVLGDVSRLPNGLPNALRDFVAAGNGVLISLGPSTTAESFQRLYQQSGLLPNIQLTRIRQHDPNSSVPTTVAPYSLEAGWLNRFRERRGATLLTSAFSQWWMLEVSAKTGDNQGADADGDSGAEADANAGSDAAANSAKATRLPAASAKQDASAVPVTVAQLTTGDPLLLQSECGRGRVLLMTSNLDAAWNVLPSKPDYVPFLHEALFQMAASKVSRNVGFGQPLLTVVPGEMPEEQLQQLKFFTPFDDSEPALLVPESDDWSVRLTTTRVPGVYRLAQEAPPAGQLVDAFVVNYDHAEDDPAELTKDDRSRLIVNDRLTFLDSLEVLQQSMYSNESTSELWALLMWLFLGLLMFETWMTRRLVKAGHVDTSELQPHGTGV